MANTQSSYTLLVFDWDGTLYDSTATIVQAIQAAGRDVLGATIAPQQAAWVIGMGLRDALAHIAPQASAAQQQELSARYLYHYTQLQHTLSLFPGTIAMLQALKARGYLLAVATGKSRRGLNEALAHTELHGLFDATRTADETAGKPDPLMLHELMEELDCSAAQTLMIGDTTHDLQLAANAACASVAVSFGAHEPEDFARYAPLAVVHSTQELAAYLLNLS